MSKLVSKIIENMTKDKNIKDKLETDVVAPLIGKIYNGIKPYIMFIMFIHTLIIILLIMIIFMLLRKNNVY